VLVTLANRLKTKVSDFAADVEAPTPNTIMKPLTSERTLTLARPQIEVDKYPQLKCRLT
jgi:hypothetical protein